MNYCRDHNVKHALIEHTIISSTKETFKIRGEDFVCDSLDTLIKHYAKVFIHNDMRRIISFLKVLQHPLKENDIDLGSLKEIVDKYWDVDEKRRLLEEEEKESQGEMQDQAESNKVKHSFN
jgi:hypothetical protein